MYIHLAMNINNEILGNFVVANCLLFITTIIIGNITRVAYHQPKHGALQLHGTMQSFCNLSKIDKTTLVPLEPMMDSCASPLSANIYSAELVAINVITADCFILRSSPLAPFILSYKNTEQQPISAWGRCRSISCISFYQLQPIIFSAAFTSAEHIINPQENLDNLADAYSFYS